MDLEAALVIHESGDFQLPNSRQGESPRVPSHQGQAEIGDGPSHVQVQP